MIITATYSGTWERKKEKRRKKEINGDGRRGEGKG